jgi:hypothetical protein
VTETGGCQRLCAFTGKLGLDPSDSEQCDSLARWWNSAAICL